MVDNSKKIVSEPAENQSTEQEKEWDNPANPEKAADERDIEQFKRQQKEAERRKENLTDDNQTTKEEN